MDEQTPEQPKKRGWPLGKKRGPRAPGAPSVPPPAATTNPTPLAPPEPAQAPGTEPPEPVSVEAITTTGQRVSLTASSFLVQNGRYVFTSYPPMRGYKRVTILRAEQLASLSVTAPEEMAEMLKVAPVAPQPNLTSAPLTFPGTDSMTGGMGAGPIVYGPPLQRPPYVSGDPRRVVDPRAERAATIPNAPGIPMSEISKGEDGVPETVRATMG